jgi:hypothetical protein
LHLLNNNLVAPQAAQVVLARAVALLVVPQVLALALQRVPLLLV